MIRLALAAGLLLGPAVLASAQTTLRVGDQKGNSQAVMEAAGVLKDVPYKIEWKEFPAAAPLLEALGAGAIETGPARQEDRNWPRFDRPSVDPRRAGGEGMET
jgi:sulfonate transport system substrate-binding protein